MADITWANEKRTLSQLIPWPRNPRQIKGASVKRLQESFNEFGQVETVAVGPGNEVYNGHQRLKSWFTEFGDVEVDVRVSSRPLTEKEREKLTVYLHKGATGDFDFEILANEFELTDLLEWGFEPFEFGLEDEKPEPAEDPGAQIDKADELQKAWGTALGQLWQLGDHRLIVGDCTDAAVVARLMDGEKAALFATDPPYGVNYSKLRTSQADMRRTTVEYEDISADTMDGPELQLFLEKCFTEWLPFLRPNAAWYLWHAQLTQGFFAAAAAAAANILIHRQIIWVKPSFIFGRGDYHWRHELCFFGWQKGNRPPFYGERNQDTVWDNGLGGGSSGALHKDHPTQKPVQLWEVPIMNHTKPGEIVADPFAGSGTTGIACEQLGRKARMAEISPAYCAVILQRWATMTGKTPVLID